MIQQCKSKEMTEDYQQLNTVPVFFFFSSLENRKGFVCGKNFKKPSGYKIHVMGQAEERNNQCLISKNSLAELSSLKQNHSTYTGQNNPAISGKHFSKVDQSRTHLLSHSEIKGKTCEIFRAVALFGKFYNCKKPIYIFMV